MALAVRHPMNASIGRSRAGQASACATGAQWSAIAAVGRRMGWVWVSRYIHHHRLQSRSIAHSTPNLARPNPPSHAALGIAVRAGLVVHIDLADGGVGIVYRCDPAIMH